MFGIARLSARTPHPIEEGVDFSGTSSQPYYDIASVLINATHLPNLMTSFLIEITVSRTKLKSPIASEMD